MFAILYYLLVELVELSDVSIASSTVVRGKNTHILLAI